MLKRILYNGFLRAVGVYMVVLLCGCTDIDDDMIVADTNNERPRTIMLFGASFASSNNGWFELGCARLGADYINMAVSGEAIYHNAVRMKADTQYGPEELDKTDLLVIMHVHNQDVSPRPDADGAWVDFVPKYSDYSGCYDYVIRKYMADCAALEFDVNSKYYGIRGGKPAKIMLCTHWHDSRTVYNTSVRELARRWDLPLVEFDKNIGFSKDDAGNKDPGEPSRAMAADTEIIDGVKFGWHPKRGMKQEIQQRMADIFVNAVVNYYNLELIE